MRRLNTSSRGGLDGETPWPWVDGRPVRPEEVEGLDKAATWHAITSPGDPHADLAAAGYRRWINRAGDVKVLRAYPVTGDGPWVSESLDQASRILPRLRRVETGEIEG